MKCAVCKSPEAVFICDLCGIVPYCSQSCAEDHWSVHSALCPTLIAGKRRLDKGDDDDDDDGKVNINFRKPCFRGYVLTTYIASGAHGSVYVACEKNNCEYVMKIQNLDGTEENAYTMEIEIDYTRLFSTKYNVGPVFKDGWICDDDDDEDGERGFIVAEKWDETMVPGQELPVALVRKLEGQIRTLHENGYVHLDILPKNVLLMRGGAGEVSDVTLTDFGLAHDSPFPVYGEDKAWVIIMYNYHKDTFPEYFSTNNITFNNVMGNISILDRGLIWMLDTSKREGGWKTPPRSSWWRWK